MYMEIGSRGNGKTERLLKFAKKNDAIVICNNPFAMKEKAREYGIPDIECVSYYDTIEIQIRESAGDRFRDHRIP